MVHRQTQSSEYWSSFEVGADDVNFLESNLLESEMPKRADELAPALIQHLVAAENSQVQTKLSGQTIYQPKKTFAVNESIAFPALEFKTGVVKGIRPGNNPELGEFEVIQVEMASGKTNEFVANFPGLHRLNDLDPNSLLSDTALLTAEQLAELYGDHVTDAINTALSESHDFIKIKEEWFLRAMMTEVNVGHLNLAEAVLDMANGGPLTTDVLLRDLGLPPDVADGVQEASLNAVLASDPRFDEISLNERPAWFLRRLEPSEVREIPAPLVPAKFTGGQVTLSPELQALAVELDDELEFNQEASELQADQVSIVLTFPHRRAGTLGWSSKVAQVLPKIAKNRIPITFRDKLNNRDFTVWLVREGRYVWGLADWFKQNEIPAGVYLELSRGPDDNVVFIDFKRRRPRREWVRVASSRDNRLRLDTAQRAVSCEFDDLMGLFADDPRTLDTLRGTQPRDVTQAVREAFPEIVKLSPQGNVHARTLYAAVNVVTRAAPTDVFAALVSAGAYAPVGDNYWHLSE